LGVFVISFTSDDSFPTHQQNKIVKLFRRMAMWMHCTTYCQEY